MTITAESADKLAERGSPSELLSGIGTDVWRHPMLRIIAEEAPTPKHAEKHIRDLGWPELGIQLRFAAELVKKDRKLWAQGGKSSATRPVDNVFTFCANTGPSPFNDIITEESFIMGDRERVQTICLPYFLREARSTVEPTCVSSFDGDGSRRWHTATLNAEQSTWYNSGAFGFGKGCSLDGRVESPQNSDFDATELALTHSINSYFSATVTACSRVHSRFGFDLQTDILPIKIGNETIPGWYKAGKLERQNVVDGFRDSHDTVLILLRRDLNPNNLKGTGTLGQVVFERHIYVHGSQSGRHDPIRKTQVRLLATYQIGVDLKLSPVRSCDVKTSFIPDAYGNPIHVNVPEIAPIQKAQACLNGLAIDVWSANLPPTLEQLAGLELITKPVEDLSSLFTKEEQR